MNIGIHVNTLPTTVFIDRLLDSLVKRGHKVIVFGTAIKKFTKVEDVLYINFNLYSVLNISKIAFFLKHDLLLSLFKRKEKKKLNAMLHAANNYNRHYRTQFYPILWHQPEVLHVQWVKGIEQFLWVKDFEMKLAASLRGSHIYLTPLIEADIANSYKNTFPQVDGVHSVCQDLINKAKEYNIPVKRSMVIYSGLKIEDFEFLKPSEKKSSKADGIKIISVGRASWMKGFDVAIDAMKILKNRNVKFEYSIVGAKNAEELTFQVHDLDLHHQVKLLDWRAFERVKELIQTADILLVSSVSEGIANTAIEAMALGTLVISTECGGMTELISNGETGMTVPMRNPVAIVDAIEQLVGFTTQQKDEMASQARKKIEQDFNMDNNSDAFEEFYMRCLEA